MPRHAPVLECSAEDKATLIAISMSGTEEARMKERARIILSRLDGKEIQQVARELRVSIPTVTKWCKRFALWGVKGLGDEPRSGKPVTYDAAFRNRVLALLEQPPPLGMSAAPSRYVPLGRTRRGRETRLQYLCGLARTAPGRHPPSTTPELVREHRQGVCGESGRCGRALPQPAAERGGAEHG